MSSLSYPRFEIFLGNDCKYYWNYYSDKKSRVRYGSMLHSVRGYATKQNCIKNIVAVQRKVMLTNSKLRKHAKYDRENFYTVETANISGCGLYFWINGTKSNPETGLKNKLALSKIYKGKNWQIPEIGVNKAVSAILKSVPNATILDSTK